MKLVQCIRGHNNLLINGEIYTVIENGENGYILLEVSPPPPYTSFKKDRFIDIDLDSIDISELTNLLVEEV